MKFDLKLDRISMNARGVIKAMKPQIIKAMDATEDRLIEVIQKEIDRVEGSPHDWRTGLKEDIKRIREEIARDVIRYYIGPDYPEDPENYAWMRAMVIAFGNEPPIYAGPAGRIVWDNDLLNRTESKVMPRDGKQEIPESWYHTGRNYIENAITIMRTEFVDIVAGVMQDIPNTIFTENMKTSKR